MPKAGLSSVRLDGLVGFIAQATAYELLPDVRELMIEAAMVRFNIKRTIAA